MRTLSYEPVGDFHQTCRDRTLAQALKLFNDLDFIFKVNTGQIVSDLHDGGHHFLKKLKNISSFLMNVENTEPSIDT